MNSIIGEELIRIWESAERQCFT